MAGYGRAETDSPSKSYNLNTNYEPDSTYVPPTQDDTYTYQNTNDNPFAETARLGQASSHVTYGDNSDGIVPAVDVAGPNPNDTVLEFQDSTLSHNHVSGKMGAATVPKVSSYSHTADNKNLLQGQQRSDAPENGPAPSSSWSSWFSLASYRKYFNVDTEDVLVRMRDSVIGSYKADFVEKVGENADLYGPFWIATTLIFVSAVTGNYASYIDYKQHHKGPTTGQAESGWYYDINKVSFSAVLFYCYVFILGLLLYVLLRYYKAGVRLSTVWCVYGYALSIFIPISVLCIFPSEIARWSLVGAATLTSGLFILLNMKAPLYETAGHAATPIILALAALHLGLGLVLKLYFFRYKTPSS